MPALAPVDSVDIQVLVDNVTDSLSSVPDFVETEMAGLGRRRGAAWVMGGACLCCAAHGLSCLLTIRAAQTIAGDSVFVSGEIPRTSGFETGLPGQHRRTEDGTGWEPDELLMDERFIAVHVRGKGLVVLTACSHAGVVNVLTEARDRFPGVKLHAVLGGLHLSGTNERIIPQTVAALRDFDLDVIAAGHCTGWRALSALANAFGDAKLAPLAVGKRLSF